MGVVIDGAQKLIKTLAILGGDVHLAGRNAMRRGIVKIQTRAQEYAPREYGPLEESIKIQESNPSRGQWTETVYVDESQPAPDRQRKSGPVTVGQYAKFAHDNIPGGIGKGAESIAKARSNGRRVGPRFMARAFKDLKDEVKRDVEAAIQAAIARRDAKKASAPLRTARDKAAPVRKAKRPKRSAAKRSPAPKPARAKTTAVRRVPKTKRASRVTRKSTKRPRTRR
jgi:hypothetical protein